MTQCFNKNNVVLTFLIIGNIKYWNQTDNKDLLVYKLDR